MKIWQAILLPVLLVMMPVLSACDLFGSGSQAEQQREHYERQLEAYRKVQEANKQAQEAYNEQIRQGLDEWSKAYKTWVEQQQQQQLKQLEQVEGMPTDNQS